MQKLKLLISILAVALGVSLFIYGKRDDNQGARALGAITLIAGIVGAIRSRKRLP